jgi:hypothetical protein
MNFSGRLLSAGFGPLIGDRALCYLCGNTARTLGGRRITNLNEVR